MAGHSKWANIKHRKARVDAKRGTQWSKCARAIIVAAKNGGADPATNLTLRYAIEEARAVNMPKDTIANAVKKGAGELAAETYESIIYEGYGPSGVAVLLEILTDNRNRTAGEIRKIFEQHNGNLGASGCVSYLFQTWGQIMVAKGAVDDEKLMEVVIDAGGDDVIDDDESWQVLCSPARFMAVRQALEAAQFPQERAQITQIPSSTITCTGGDARRLINLLEALEEHDDVQKAYANFEIPDEEMTALEG